MRDEKEEWKQTSCWWSKVSLLPDFLSLISLGDASDYPVWLPFSISYILWTKML